MSEINKKQNELIEDFELFDDWEDKYQYIMDLGKKLKPIPEENRNPELLIKGCQSQVWLDAELKDGKIYFIADSDALLVKGLVYMITGVLSGHTPREIQEAELYFVDKIGLRSHLAQTRSNGLAAMLKQMKLYALAFASKTK